MEMEADLERNLHALRKLYVLLLTNVDHVDEEARLLFKNLLDAATDNFLHIQSSIPVSDQSTRLTTVSVSSSKPQNRKKKRCRVCQQTRHERGVIGQAMEADTTANEKQKPYIHDAVPSVGFSSSFKNPKETASDFAKQVSNSIKLLDSVISSLHLCSWTADPIKITSPPVIQSIRMSEASNNYRGNITTQACKQVLMGNLGNGKIGQCQTVQYVHGLRIPPGLRNSPTHALNMKTKKKLSKQIMAQEEDSITQKENRRIGKLMKFQQCMQLPGQVEDSKALSHYKNQAQLLMKPALLDYNSLSLHNVNRRANRKGGLTNRRYPGLLQQKKTLPYQQESDQTSMSSSTSSHSTTSPSETKTSTNTSSDMSRRLGHVTPESSIEERWSSGSYNDVNVSPLRRADPRKTCQSSSPDKAIGPLRRFKNKLGLIFHHHHHHHHHRADDNGSYRKHNRKAPTASMWTHLQKIFHHNDKRRNYEKQAVGKLRSSAARKNQVGQLQAIVQGMMRHVKHSKKSQFSKGGIPRGRNKHWWQMFQRHRGVRLSNRGRLKLQFMSQKPSKLRAPKKMT